MSFWRPASSRDVRNAWRSVSDGVSKAVMLATGAAMFGRLRTTLAAVRVGGTSSAPMEATASSFAKLLPRCGNA